MVETDQEVPHGQEVENVKSLQMDGQTDGRWIKSYQTLELSG